MGREHRVAIVWFRRDLRVHDHPALTAALERAERVVPLFVFDPALLHGRLPSPNRASFLIESVGTLGEELRRRGAALRIRIGPPDRMVAEVAAEAGATAVFASRDYSPFARHRDERVSQVLGEAGIPLLAGRGVLVQEPEAIAAADGSPHRVYSPFLRAWRALPRREVLPAPADIRAHGGVSDALPTLETLGVDGGVAPLRINAGEPAARERLDAFLRQGLAGYATGRDALAEDATSRLSQDLHFGLLSANEVVSRAAGSGDGARRFVGELCWRDFYTHVLWHWPRAATTPFQPGLDSSAYRDDPHGLDAWRTGRTGFPIVDAGMRQLAATGWMHNRARMIVASFLTKDLLIDWREGERHFGHHLTDGDLASNNGGWQWVAGSGTDPQPFFRIFNPTRQGTTFDPGGSYVRRWVPELAGVPDEHVHEPWRMSLAAQAAAGCAIGRDYPAPIVEHAAARRRALDAWEATRKPVRPAASNRSRR